MKYHSIVTVFLAITGVVMLIASLLAYTLNGFIQRARYANASHMNFETPLTVLVWLTSAVSIGFTYLLSWLLIPNIGGDASLWWKLSTIITFGTLAGSMLPFVLRRLRLDPASASAPFVATLVDVTGLVIYFSVAMLILKGTLL